MITTSVTDAKSHFSALLKHVERGETVLVLHHGRPVARIEPVNAVTDAEGDALLARLEREGAVRRASEPPDPAVLDGAAPRLGQADGLLAALIEDRAGGR